MIFLFSLFETDQRWYCMELIIYVICLDTRYSPSHLMFMQYRQSCYVHCLLNRTHSCNCRWILLSWRKTLYVSLEFGRFRVFLHSYHFYSVSIGEQIERVIRWKVSSAWLCILSSSPCYESCDLVLQFSEGILTIFPGSEFLIILYFFSLYIAKKLIKYILKQLKKVILEHLNK